MLQPRFGFWRASRLHAALTHIKNIDAYKLAVKVLIVASIIDACILPILFIKIYYYPSLRAVEIDPHAQALITADPGPATTNLLNKLSQHGFAPNPIMTMSRPQFSVQGRIIAFADDNIQIFEYPDSPAARTEYDAFMQKNTKTYRHAYRENNIIALYIGDKPTIMQALENVFNNK
jgi:hypothetical protein